MRIRGSGSTSEKLRVVCAFLAGENPTCRRDDSRRHVNRLRLNEDEPELGGFPAQGFDVRFAMAAFEFCLADVFVLEVIFKHVIDGSGDLIGGCNLSM